MADLGKAYVQIVPSAEGISGSISSVIAPEATEAGKDAGTKISQSISSGLSNLGKGMMKGGAVATAISVPIIAGVKKALTAYAEQSSAETKLIEIYKKRMGVDKEAAQSTIDLASKLQQTGIIGDEVALSGAQQLATFAKYPSTVNSLMPAMNNLLAQQKGYNATSQDATNIANLMGKVLTGNVGALKRVGISFTDSQEQVMKYGTEEEKAAMLAQVITDNVGDMNQAMAQTPEGSIAQVKNSLGDMAESLGAVLAPAVADLAQYVSTNVVPALEKVINYLKEHPKITKVALAVAGLMAVLGPVVVVLGGLIAVVGAIIPVITAVSAPVLIIIGVIGALIAVMVYVTKHADQITKALSEAWNAIKKSISEAVEAIKSAVVEKWNAIVNKVKEVSQNIRTFVASSWEAVKSKVSSVVTGVKSKVTGAWDAIKTKTSNVWSKVKEAISKPITAARTTAENVVKKIKSFLQFAGLKETVQKTFNDIKQKITKPISTAKTTVEGVINKIKGWFPISIGKVMSGIKLPHFTKEGKFSLNPPSVPKFSISWNAKAMDRPWLFRDATLFGAGETGDEILYGRRRLLDDIAEASNGGSTNNVTFNVTVNGAEDPEDWASRFVRQLRQEVRMA